MSDIKYIIAGGDGDGEHYTRFGCLAMVRYAVAAVVTVLTITVIALSIHAVLRSEDVGLSVNKGFIGADTLWNHTIVASASTTTTLKSPMPGNRRRSSSPNKVAEPATGAAKVSRRRGLVSLLPAASDESDVYSGVTTQLSIGSSSKSLPKDCFLGCSGGDRDEPTQVTFTKPDRTNLRVILIANNPGGRTKIDCNSTRVSLVDMDSPYGQIGNVTLDNFTVPPQTTITLQKRLSITDTSYIWKNYHLASRFSVQVRVTSSVTSYPLGKRGKTVQQNYTCEPVTVGLIEDEDIYASDDHVHCTSSSSG